MPHSIGRYALALLAVAASAVPASTAPAADQKSKAVLDQSNTLFSSSINVNDPAYDWEQGITPAVTGRLTQIDLYVHPSQTVSGPTQLTLYSGAPWQFGEPTWRQLVTLSAGWNTIRLTRAKFSVIRGQPFTLGMHCPESTYCGAPFIGFSYDDAYVSGSLFMNGEEQFAHDMMFRTWVQP
jgi:hypothetical protein